MSNPGLSVLLPVHSTRFLRETLESIFRSEMFPGARELVLVLDRVPIESVNREIPPNLSFFTLRIIESKNPGIVAALNLGLSHCNYDYVARIDEDDLVHPKRFMRQVKFLESHKEYVAVGGNIKLIDANGQTLGVKTYPKSDKQIRKSMPRKSPIAHPASMFVRQSVQSIGGYREGVPEDWDLWCRLSKIGKLRNLPFILIDYRQHSDQLSRNSFYKLRIARRRLILGTHLSEGDLNEISDSRIEHAKLLTDLSPEIKSLLGKSLCKSLKRIEDFDSNYQGVKDINLKTLIRNLIKYPDLIFLEIFLKVRSVFLLMRTRKEF